MTSRERLPLLAAYGGMIALSLPGNVVALSLTAIGKDYELTSEMLGRLPAISSAVWVITLLTTGPLADRVGAKVFFLIGSLFTAIGMAAYGLGGSYAAAMAGAALYGLGGGMLDMITSPVVAALFPNQRAEALNRLHAFFSIGSILALAVGLTIIAVEGPWRLIFGALGIVPLLVFALSLRAKFPPLLHEDHVKDGHRVAGSFLFWLFAALIFLCGASEMGLVVWLPAHIERSFETTSLVGGLGLLGFFLAMTIGRLVGGRILRHAPPMRVLTGAALASAPMIALAAWHPLAPVSFGAAILVGLTTSILWPTTLALAGHRFPKGGATLYGWLAAAGNSSGVAIPWLIGVIADRSSTRDGVGATALAPVLMLIVLALVRSVRAKQEPATP